MSRNLSLLLFRRFPTEINSLMFLSHGNSPQHIFAVKRHRIHWKDVPVWNKNRSRAEEGTQQQAKSKECYSRERKFSDAAKHFPPRCDLLAHRLVALSRLFGHERKFCGGENRLVSFPRFSTFSTASHHSLVVQLRTGCCRLPRMVGIIATNRSHKLKSFYGISTLPF